ncbi:MAG TPA: DUF4292 domain-containing protein [Fodinibius sp.]|nr:DUF4292 domain-containing protein [Fodinibius sp.]
MRYIKPQQLKLVGMFICGLLVASCSSTQKFSKEGFHPSSVSGKAITEKMPDYSADIHSLKGKGRAIVSEPGNTERVTLLFSSTRSKSLVTIRNGLGIEGGELLTDGDTLTVYNKVDKYIRKIPIRSGELNSINRLASLNILDILNYSPKEVDIDGVSENATLYRLSLANGATVFVNKKTHAVEQVVQPASSRLPYSKITYNAFSQLQGFMLPRRITIFGADKKSKIALQLSSLELNPSLDSLTINVPDDIPIYHR